MRPLILIATATAAFSPLLQNPAAHAQSQSLAFTGGVLLNTRLSFSNLGAHPPATPAGPDSGASEARLYDDGFVHAEPSAAPTGTTAHWGYQSSTQLRGSDLVMSSKSAIGNLATDDSAAFFEPSAHLEYRGGLGEWGRSAWGLTLGIGYQSINGNATASYVTESRVTEDRFSFAAGTEGPQIPAAPFAGTEGGTGARLGLEPTRSFRIEPGARLMTGYWELETELIPMTGGLYLETQLAGRLNGVFSAGLLAAFINADLKFRETSTIAGVAPRVSTGGDGSNDFILGGFVQAGFDWALWERASLVASARWQPTETFTHSVSGREAELDFSSAFAIHAGFSMRF